MTDDSLEAYLDYCRAIKLSDRTVSGYARSLQLFLGGLQSHGKTLPQASGADAVDFIAVHPNWDAATVSNRLSALRGYYKWAELKRLLPGDNPMLGIRSPKPKVVKNKPSVTREEAYLLTQARRTRKDGSALATDLRDRCLIALIADTGLRVSEAASLNIGHIRRMDPNQREFVYVGKGGSEQTWYMTADVYQMLSRYIDALPDAELTAPLFRNRDGGRLSVRSIQLILQRRGASVLNRHVHPHMLRRGFGNAFYAASGKDIYATSQAMHHTNIATTQGYLSIQPGELKNIVDGMSTNKPSSRTTLMKAQET